MKTSNLDEAAYLLYKGHRPTVRAHSKVHATFTFKNSPQLEKDSTQFLRGRAEVVLTKYLYCRLHLKAFVSKEAPPQVPPKKPHRVIQKFGFTSGTPYYYVENDEVKHAVAGRDPMHAERYKAGNFYTTKDEAALAI